MVSHLLWHQEKETLNCYKLSENINTNIKTFMTLRYKHFFFWRTYIPFMGPLIPLLLDFWWSLFLWVRKPEGANLFMLGRGICNICSLIFSMAASDCSPHVSAEVGCWIWKGHLPHNMLTTQLPATNLLAYFHYRSRIQTPIQRWIHVLCRIFPLVQIWSLIPWLKCMKLGQRSVLGTEIHP